MAFENYCTKTGYHFGSLYKFTDRSNWQACFIVPPHLRVRLRKRQIIWSTGTANREIAKIELLALRRKAWNLFADADIAHDLGEVAEQ